MARGFTRPQCLAIEQATLAIITKALGPPITDCGSYDWTFPYGDTGGTISIHFYPGTEHDTVYRAPWLACRLKNPAHVKPDGYTKDLEDMPTRWPGVFTYPSGKANLHSFSRMDLDTWIRSLAQHLYSIAAEGSPEKEAFGDILIPMA